MFCLPGLVQCEETVDDLTNSWMQLHTEALEHHLHARAHTDTQRPKPVHSRTQKHHQSPLLSC